MQDLRGLQTSTEKASNIEAYERTLRAFNTYRGDAVAMIDETLKDDPGFIMGLVLRGQVLVSMWEKSVLPELEETIARLDKLGSSNEREQQHALSLRQWAAGDWQAARATLDRLLADYPRDLLALQIGHLADFYHGDRDNLRGRIERAMPAWTRDDVGHSFLLGMHAFGLEECGSYSHAEDVGRQALELEAEDCWAQHAIAHVMEMQARQDEAIAFMQEREPYWAQPDNGFQFHNWWHTALYNLDQGSGDRALEIYDNGIRPFQSDVQLMMLDATALLWRMYLQGLDAGNRWTELADKYEADDEAGFYIFNDMHAMMAFAATGRSAAAAARLAAVEAVAGGETTNSEMVRAVGLSVLRGIDAFACEHYDEVVQHLMPVRYRAFVFGGSHAQRDILHRTLIEASLRAGDATLATALCNERKAHKPLCPFTGQLAERARAAAST